MKGGPDAYWVGEVEPRQETSASFGDLEIELGELACYFDVSNRLLEDNAYDIVPFMNEQLRLKFASKEGVAFLTGNGVKKPYGILVDALLPKLASGDAMALTTDALIDLDSAPEAGLSAERDVVAQPEHACRHP